GDIERTNLFKDAPPSVPLVINIDHHVTNTRFGHINWVEESASATGELIYYLIERLGLRITPDIATCLYTTLLTETGNFNYSNTSSKVLRIAADLVEAGADPWKIAMSLGENSPERLRLLGELLINIEKSRDGKIAWFTITNALFERTKTSAEDTENLINYPRSLVGVEVALLFREVSPDSYKVSLRSKGHVNVAEIATKFAGGGHKNAAGCLVKGRLDIVKDLVIGAIESVTSSGICKD
ncbi:MAG: bifunctional oligoribonuclease/PAP phosphatase NrnA, partial [Nitrospirota bacterium]